MTSLAHYFEKTRGHIAPGAHRVQQLLNACCQRFSHAENTRCFAAFVADSRFSAVSAQGATLRDFLHHKPHILVTGTNGKGSVCAMLDAGFRSCGYKMGLYTSPHLISPTERICIEGKPIPHDYLVLLLEQIDAVARSVLPDVTFFELMTAAACVAFWLASVDFAIFEVGMGGRYDSCNVISPAVSVLTSVGLDHKEFLGSDCETIAFDKSFISRRNRIFIVSDELDAGAQMGVERAAQVTGCLLPSQAHGAENTSCLQALSSLLGDETWAWGKCNHSNIKIVFRAVQAWQSFVKMHSHFSWSEFTRGVRGVFWPGRFDVRHRGNGCFLFDVCHNSHGVRFFLKHFLEPFLHEKSASAKSKRVDIVFGAMLDKDWQDSLTLLLPYARSLRFVQMASSRSVTLAQWRSVSVPPEILVGYGTAAEIAQDVLLSAPQSDVPVLVVGSVALVGEMMSHMGFTARAD